MNSKVLSLKIVWMLYKYNPLSHVYMCVCTCCVLLCLHLPSAGAFSSNIDAINVHELVFILVSSSCMQ